MASRQLTIGDRVRTNDAYMAVGGPRAVRKPFSGLVVKVLESEPGLVKVLEDRTTTPSWYWCEWFDRLEDQ